MSTTIDQAFVKQFEEEVHQAYQRMGSKLRNTVRVKNSVQGSSTVFQKVGKGSASTKARHGKVPVMNVDHTPVECQLQDFYAGDWVDQLDELKINIDERQVLANAGAFALGRKTDDLIITALGQTANTAGAGTDGLTKAKVLEAFEMLGREGRAGRRPALRRDRLEAVVATCSRSPEFANADFVGPDELPWRGTQAKHWLGTLWLPHSGLELNADVRRCFWYHRSAIGHAIGQEVDHRHHLARRPRRALRVQFDEPGRLPDRRRRRHRDAQPGELSMAYDASNLSALTYANGFTLWHYKTPDTAAVVDSTGYFNGAAAMLRVGDFIFANANVNATMQSGVFIVASNAGGVVDVSDITGVRDGRYGLTPSPRRSGPAPAGPD